MSKLEQTENIFKPRPRAPRRGDREKTIDEAPGSGEDLQAVELDRQGMIGSNDTISACALAMKRCGIAIVEPTGWR